MGIEPTAQAWEAWVLPLYDARAGVDSSRIAEREANGNSRCRAGAPSRSGWQHHSFLEMHFSRQLVGAPDDAREIQRCGVQEVAAGAGQRREWRLPIEDIVDDQANLEVFAHVITHGRIDDPPVTYGHVVPRVVGEGVVEIHCADEYALPVPGERPLEIHQIHSPLVGRDTGLTGVDAQLAG